MAVLSTGAPSTSTDRSRRGGAEKALTQTMKRRESGGAARRWTTFPSPQAAAAATHRAKAPSGPATPKSNATRASPQNATASPSTRRAVSRSPSSVTANSTVNSACICRTREVRPAGMPARIPTSRSPNWPAPRVAATPATQRHGTPGRPTKSRAGNAAMAKRTPAYSRGGKYRRPICMTTKLKPQTAARPTARARWRGLTQRAGFWYRIRWSRACSASTLR